MTTIKRRGLIETYKFIPQESKLLDFKILNNYENNIEEQLKSSIYSEFIPLNTVLKSEVNGIFNHTNFNITKFPQCRFDKTPLSNCFKYELYNRGLRDGEEIAKMNVRHYLNSYLQEDKIYNYLANHSRYYINRTYQLENYFKMCTFTNFSMRSFVGLIGNYHFFDGYKPTVLPVIHQSALLEVKYNFILTGKIDTGFITLFIDKEIENTGYTNKNFRASYKKYIEPQIKESGMNICYVSQDFIKENCFLQPLKLSNNLIRRKQEIREKIEEFINSIKVENELQPL